MARMLGRYANLTRKGFPACCCEDCETRGSARWRKRVEAREVERELAPGADREWLATLGPLYDLSDCQHGCNGDCVVSGSERCTFVCHDDAATLPSR